MIRRFELTGDLGIAPWRGRRSIAPEIVEEITVAMTENSGINVRSSSSETLRVKQETHYERPAQRGTSRHGTALMVLQESNRE